MLQVLFQLCLIALLLYCWGQRQPGLIRDLLLVIAVGNLITIPFIFVVLRQRVKEIEKGELEEAGKY